MIRRLFTVAVSVSLAACTTVQHMAVNTDASAKLQGSTVASTRHPKPDFSAFTARMAVFGAIATPFMITDGNAIVNDNDVEDPAALITSVLQARLAQSKGTRPLAPTQVTESDDVATLVAGHPGAGFVLDVETVVWMISYYPTDWAHYRVIYSARFRLVDASKHSVVAQAVCNTVQGDDRNPPSKDQLLADKAALLKMYLSRGAGACADQFTRDILTM